MEKEEQNSTDESFEQAEKYQQLADVKPEFTPPSSIEQLENLKRSGKAIRTSSGVLFGGENDVWTRDMSITAEDLINIDPEITQEAILTLASFQGIDSKWKTGEKPGKMHTEHREIYNNPALDMKTKFGLSVWAKFLLQNGWSEYTTYHSGDTTPLFLKTVYEYSRVEPSILEAKVEKKDGSSESIKEVAIKAAEYIDKTVGEDGLIRLKEENVFGNQFRYWRDSPNSYLDDKGHTPNIVDPMIILDIQGLSVEALDDAAKLIAGVNPEKTTKWLETANRIRKATIDKMWMEDEQYFAFALHFDKDSKELVPLKTIQSNAGWLLNTDFFDNMQVGQKQRYITGIVKKLMSDEFLTDAGIRCRSTRHIADRDFADYHGSWVSWPVESYMIAKGLRRQGFDGLADQIETRILNAVNMSGVNYEFFVTDQDGKVLLDPNSKPEKLTIGSRIKNMFIGAKQDIGPIPLPIEMKPENTIAWTVTATLRMKKERGDRWRQEHVLKESPVQKEAWIGELEQEVLSKIPELPNYKTKAEISNNRYQEPNLYIKQGEGFTRAAGNIAIEMTPDILKDKVKRPFRKK